MPMKTSTILQVVSALLILLFVYTALSKLQDFEQFKVQLYAQTLPHALATVLIWTLPELELITAALLFFERTRPVGLWISFALMVLFTGYIALVLLDFFGRVPCSCGGVIKTLGWKLHLVFNLIFLLLTILSIVLENGERRSNGKQESLKKF